MAKYIAALVLSLSLLVGPSWAGTWYPNLFGYGPHQTAEGSTNNSNTILSQQRIDTKLGKVVFVTDPLYGAAGNGVTDDTTAINNAVASLASTGGVVYLPQGTYKTTAPIAWTSSGIYLVGAGEDATKISGTAQTGNIITIGSTGTTTYGGGVKELTITSTTVKTAGAAIYVVHGDNIHLERLHLKDKLYTGIQFEDGVKYFLRDFQIYAGVGGTGPYDAIVVGDTNPAFGVYVNNGNVYGASNCGLLLRSVGGFYLDAVDLIACKHGFMTNPDTGKTVNGNLISQMLADTSSDNGYHIVTNGGYVTDFNFVNCWAGSNGTALGGKGTEEGVYINAGTGGISGLIFSALRAINNKGAGVYNIDGTQLTFDGCQIMCNSMRGNNARAGWESDVGNFTINGGMYGRGGIFTFPPFSNNYQAFGILINAGTAGNYQINGPDTAGNVTAGISDLGTGGSNRGTVTLTANAATTTVNNSLITSTSRIQLMPTTANAAADQGSATGVWISAKVDGTSFTITHPNTAAVDKTFDYTITN